MKPSTNYTQKEELLNSISHAIGVIMAIVAAFILLNKASLLDTKVSVIATATYIFGILFSYGASTIYHALPVGKNKQLLRKYDHAAIYLHIAGSYTPFTLIALKDYDWWGYGLFTFIWISALLGVILSFTHLKGHSRLSTVCYVLMGLSVLVAFKPLWNALSAININSFYYVMAGGLSFIIGALFYSLNKRKYMHSVFHVFCLIGSIFHIMAIYLILV